MSYVNPLHPPVPSSSRSHFSSLGGAVPHPSPETRRRLPQPLCKSNGTTPLQNPVSFDYLGFSGRGHGVPMQDLAARGAQALAQMMDRAEERLNIRSASGKIALRIQWPGYEHLEWVYPIDLTLANGGALTRSNLGAAVSLGFVRFIEKYRSEPSRSAEWRLGNPGIRFEHLVLVAVHNISDDVWQADVVVDTH